MTDRLCGFTVTLEKEIRDDDAQKTIDAIKQVKGVIDAQPITANMEYQLAYTRARNEIIRKLFEVLK